MAGNIFILIPRCVYVPTDGEGSPFRDGRPGPDLSVSDGFMLEHYNLQNLRILISIKVI